MRLTAAHPIASFLRFLVLACLLAGATGCAAAIDDAIDRGSAYLSSRQAEDGAWRSGVHGVFRDGTALTPHVARALRDTGRQRAALERAIAWIESADVARLAYPTYAAADAMCVSPSPKWRNLLRSRQLGAEGGLSEGGWAYPPGPMDAQAEANTSVTAYAACALADAGARRDDPSLVAARRFLLRCRNDRDGGFLFGPTESADNKAGPGVSYGSTTADAVRGLLAAGATRDDPIVEDAVDWLIDRFDPALVPGDFTSARAPMRNGNYFYYLDAVTDAFERANVPRRLWADPVSRHLLRRQRDDGSWVNEISAGREDDPLVATAFAVRTLARCRAR